MTVDMRGRNLDWSRGIEARVERSMFFALERFEDRIAWIRVRVDDVNGKARGGSDKRCTVQVHGRESWTVIVDAADTDLYAAIDAAAGRAGRAVGRTVGRVRDPRRMRTG